MSTAAPTAMRRPSASAHAMERVVIGRTVAIGILAFAAIPPFPADTLGWGLVAFIALLSALARRSGLGQLRVSLPLLALVGWAGLSAFWSVDRTPTVTGVGLMCLAAAVGVLLAAGRGLNDLLDVSAWACVLVLVGCWLAAFLAPHVAFSSDINDAGALRGLFVQKNALGYFCAFALVTFSCRLWAVSARRWFWFLAVLATVATIARSWSGTSAVASTAVLTMACVLALVARLRRPVGLVFSALIAGIFYAGLTLLRDPQVIIGAVGKDATLTGRTEIWDVVIVAITERPWQGYGWAALWRPGSPTTEELWARGGFAFYHSHNGYLDVAAQLGIVGAALAFGALVYLLICAAHRHLRQPSAANMWPVLLIALVLIYNATEVVGFKNLTWVTLVAVAVTQQKGIVRNVSALRRGRAGS